MKIFISYSHKDKTLFAELCVQLRGIDDVFPDIDAWDDTRIKSGDDWHGEIQSALQSADVVLLLVSPDFKASRYIRDNELAPALERQARGECIVVPIILRDTPFWERSAFARLQALPTAGKPVTAWRPRNRAWADVVTKLFGMIENSGPLTKTAQKNALHHLPLPRNVQFAGRQDELAWIERTLGPGQPVALLHGMGGVGKTQAANEFAHRHADDYTVVWWVAAEREADAGYGELAQALKLPGYDARDAAKTRAAVVGWMEQTPGWLVVLDNAESPAALAPWLPKRPKGHLLITSRNPHWSTWAAVHDIDVWPAEVAATFLMTRSGDRDRAAAEGLAQTLGCLPLACETAAAYAAEKGCGLAGFAERLAKQPVKLLETLPAEAVYRQALPQTITLALEATTEESPLAAEILRALAWLAPDNIPRWLLDEWPVEAMEVDDALAALLRRALVRKSGDGFAVHRLTQQIIRETDTQATHSAAAAIRVLNAALTGNPQYDVHLWPRYRALVPHGVALFAHLPDPPAELAAAGQICTYFGLFLKNVRGDYLAVKTWLEKALALTEAQSNPYHSDVALDLSNLGDSLRLMGDFTAAKPLFERALAIDEKALGPLHPKVAHRLAGLGAVHRALGELDEARRDHQRCLEIREAAHGPDHPEVAASLNNLAVVLEQLGDPVTARTHLERALEICLKHPERGRDHPETGESHHNLGAHLFEQGDAAAAAPHLIRALEIWEKYLDPGHPHLASARKWLAKVEAALKSPPAATGEGEGEGEGA